MTGRIITVAQQKGGTGKTTVAAHLAIALLHRGNSVAILDVDPQGSLGEWFEARERHLGEAATGMRFRTASGWGARRKARDLARDHDFVVVDTPPKSDSEARPAIEAANLVAVPVQPTPVDLWSTDSTLAMIARERANGESLMPCLRWPARGVFHLGRAVDAGRHRTFQASPVLVLWFFARAAATACSASAYS